MTSSLTQLDYFWYVMVISLILCRSFSSFSTIRHTPIFISTHFYFYACSMLDNVKWL